MSAEKTDIRDMTQGKPFKLMLEFSIPLMLGNLFQQLYSFVDALIVGRILGAYALAALGAVEWLTFIMFGIIQGITQGCSVVISKHFGAKRKDFVQKSIYNAFFISGICALVLLLVGESVIYSFLILLKTPSEILGLSYTYLKILYAGIPITVLYNMLAAILRAFGNSKKPLNAMLIASLGNIALDLLLVIKLNLGIAGAAYGTVLAQILAILYCIYAVRKIDLCRLERSNMILERDIILEQIKVGLPMGIQSIITAVGGLVVQAKANGFGVIFITGYSAANKIYALLEIAATSYAHGILTYTAQNKGIGNKKRIRDGLAAALLIGSFTALLMSCIMIFAGENILTLFIKEKTVEMQEAVQIGYHFLKILAFGFVLLYCLYIIRACIQGLGNSVFPMFSSLIQVFMRVLCALFLTKFIGNTGIFWGEIFAWTGADIFLLIVFLYTASYLY